MVSGLSTELILPLGLLVLLHLALGPSAAGNTCEFANDGVCDEWWGTCVAGTDSSDCKSHSSSSSSSSSDDDPFGFDDLFDDLELLGRMSDGKTGEPCTASSECPSKSCKGGSADTKNCCLLQDGFCSYCEGILTGMCGSCVPGYYLPLTKDAFKRYCTKCPSGKTTTKGYTLSRNACHAPGEKNPPRKQPDSTDLIDGSCDYSEYLDNTLACDKPIGTCTCKSRDAFMQCENEDCSLLEYTKSTCTPSGQCKYTKSFQDFGWEKAENFMETPWEEHWEKIEEAWKDVEDAFLKASQGTTLRKMRRAGSWDIDLPFKTCINADIVSFDFFMCVEAKDTGREFELRTSIGVKSFLDALLVGVDPLGIELAWTATIAKGSVPTQENAAMCEFPGIEVGMEVNYMMFTLPIPRLEFSSKMKNGEYQISLLDFVPGKAAKIMSKFGLEVGIEFKLDKLYNGGLQFAMSVYMGANPLGGALELFNKKQNLIDLFGLANSVDCDSTDLSGQGCLKLGAKSEPDEECKAPVESLSGGDRPGSVRGGAGLSPWATGMVAGATSVAAVCAAK
jgi:hypothetical protein